MERRILVVDDERGIREVLRAYLENAGFVVDEADTGADALHRAGSAVAPPDLILLDVGLPDLDGFEVLRILRRTSEVYVILVTARAEEVDRIVGLEVGADDYVTKPFSPREVVARVKSVLRRARSGPQEGEPEDPVVRVGGLALDPLRREVRIDGRAVTLTTLEFDLLLALARSPGRVYSRAQLLEAVWGYDFYGDERVVDVHIRAMRKALGDDAAAAGHRVGYRLLEGEARRTAW